MILARLTTLLQRASNSSAPTPDSDESPRATAVNIACLFDIIASSLFSLLYALLDARLYRDLLLKFRNGQASVLKELRQALRTGDQELSLRLTHTLNCVAGNYEFEMALDHLQELESLVEQQLTSRALRCKVKIH